MWTNHSVLAVHAHTMTTVSSTERRTFNYPLCVVSWQFELLRNNWSLAHSCEPLQNGDMPDEMRIETMDLCVTAVEKYSTNNEVLGFRILATKPWKNLFYYSLALHREATGAQATCVIWAILWQRVPMSSDEVTIFLASFGLCISQDHFSVGISSPRAHDEVLTGGSCLWIRGCLRRMQVTSIYVCCDWEIEREREWREKHRQRNKVIERKKSDREKENKW